MFHAKRTRRANGHVGTSADVANSATRHGRRKTPLLRKGHDPGVPETVFEDVHERVVVGVERFQRRVSVASQRRSISQVHGRR